MHRHDSPDRQILIDLKNDTEWIGEMLIGPVLSLSECPL